MKTQKELMDKIKRYVNSDSYYSLEEIKQEQEQYNFNDTVLVNKSLDNLVNELLKGLTTDQINDRLKNLFGDVIEVYYVNAEKVYCVLVGTRK